MTPSTRFTFAIIMLTAMAPRASAAEPTTRPVLRIYADPNNLPFSNRREEGFENKIAQIIAREMNAEIQYNWQALRQGFFRRAFRDNEADMIMGVPTGMERMTTTTPYYRSTYVFVWRSDQNLRLESLDDDRLRNLRIGVPIVGAETSNTPPVLALARRGIVNNVIGYTVYGDYEKDNPPARMVDAVAKSEVDVAVLWGPLVGYFARRQPVALSVAAVSPSKDGEVRFAYNISIGVKQGNTALSTEINQILERKRQEIEQILDEYGVPRLPVEQRSSQQQENDEQAAK